MKISSLLTLLLCASTLPVALGWGAWGHKMIAQIAWDMLSENAQNMVGDFLGEASLASIAPDADDYAYSGHGNWSRPMHFCNLPRNATNFTMNYCGHFCVVEAIKNYTSRLTKDVKSPFKCNLNTNYEPCALVFLVHFVGDVHQPLHVGYGDDEGGNLVEVDFYGEIVKLHHIWDDNMIEKWIGNWTEGVPILESMIGNETAKVKEYMSLTNPIEWADESFYYVRTTCYDYGNGTSKKINVDFKSIKINNEEPEAYPKIGDWYYDKNIQIIRQRLIAAGVRLGTLLNSILDPEF